MGGIGSGRTSFGGALTVATTRALDVRQLVRSIRKDPLPCIARWTSGGGVSFWPEVHKRRLVLWYSVSGQDVEQVIALDVTKPHFGGIRYWATCPDCSRRVAILYYVSGFRCRTCCGLVYDSTRETPLGRAGRRSAKAWERLRSDAGRRRWVSTRLRLLAQAQKAERIASAVFETSAIGKLVRRRGAAY